MTEGLDSMTSPAGGSSPRDELRTFIHGRVGRLQRALLSGKAGEREHASALGELAELRRFPLDASEAGFDALFTTLAGLPSPLVGTSDQPSRGERSAHAAMVLFAMHQQSLRLPAHSERHGSDGRSQRASLGRVAGALARANGDLNDGVVRRFKAIAAASTIEEGLYHLGVFIPLLKSAEVPLSLDYGQLAVDIYDLHTPRGRERVQLAWARDFHGRTHLEAAQAAVTNSGDPA